MVALLQAAAARRTGGQPGLESDWRVDGNYPQQLAAPPPATSDQRVCGMVS